MPRRKKSGASTSGSQPPEQRHPSPTPSPSPTLRPGSQVLYRPRAPTPPGLGSTPAAGQQRAPGPPPPQLAGIQVGSSQPRAPPPTWRPRATAPPGAQQQSRAPPSTGPEITTAPAGYQARAASPGGLQPATAPVQYHQPRPPSDVPATQLAGPSEAGTSSKAPTLELGFRYADPCAKLGHPRRPGLGKVGTKTVVKANHFRVTISGNDICHYHVEISPETKSKRLNREIISKAVTDGRFAGSLPAYDGQSSLYTARALSAKSSTFQVVLSDDNNRERKFKVTVQLANTLNMTQLEMFLSGRRADIPQEVIQAFDIVLRGTAIQRYSAVGRSFFWREFGCQPLGSGLEAWNGYFQSVRPTQSSLCLNIDLSTTAFIQELRVDDYVAEILGRRFDKNRPLSDADLKKVKRRLRGLKIEVTHRGPMKRRYRINDLSSQPTRSIRFECGAKLVSIEEYFMDTYRYAIRFPFLPCLQVGNPERLNYLPMELCKIAPRQRYPGKLDDSQVSKLRPLRPDARERKIVECIRGSRFNEDPYAREFGISVNPNLMLVDARVLPSPELKFSASGGSTRPRLGRWDLRNKKLANGARIERWSCINFTRQPAQLANEFCGYLIGACVDLGMVFNPDPVIAPVNARPEAVETSIVQLCSKVKQPLELLIVILPDRNGVYSEVKRVCETRLGIISQCCLEMNACKMNYQTLLNIALKINAKLGGRNAVLMDAIRKTVPVISKNVTIVFGADVTHPSPGDNSPSIAAVVASMDWPEVTKYAGVLRAQAGRKEIIDMTEMIRELLLRFYRSTKRKPERLIFYRDGVSEGQFDQVARFELDAIFKACKKIDGEYKPTVTFVIVQKRHHTRLFPKNYEDAQNVLRNGNILPGTIVDSQICQPHDFDFYLCSHASIQGTSRPAHYHVLHDENNFDADGLQKLTNDLCYTYARSTTAVSYVPPAYYAHLAAFRARHYLSNELSSGTGSGETGARELPQLCEAVKSCMFYC